MVTAMVGYFNRLYYPVSFLLAMLNFLLFFSYKMVALFQVSLYFIIFCN